MKEIKDNELNKVSGGSMHFVVSWTCPECGKVYYTRTSTPKSDDIDGVENLYCDKCNKWYPKDNWKKRVR